MADSSSSVLLVELWIKITLTLCDSFSCIHGTEGELCAVPYCPSIDSKRAVRPLSEVCRLLRDVVQPILFETVKLAPHSVRGDRQMRSLTSTLSARPDLRSSIRSLQLIRIQPGSYCDAFLKVVPLLTNVRSISLESVIINMAVVELLRNATRLHNLHLSESTWGEDVPEKWSEGGSYGENLMELSVYGWEAAEELQVGRTLQLIVPTVERLTASHRGVSRTSVY